MLIKTGSLIKNDKGSPVQNPILNVCVQRSAMLQQLARQLGTSTPSIDSRQLKNSASAVNDFRRVCSGADELLAGYNDDGFLA